MNYRDVDTLNRNIIDWIPQLPKNLDIIVGIPRSGLLVANLLALYLNLPLTDVEGLIAHRFISFGERLNWFNEKNIYYKKPLNVLIVDDSLWSGTQLNKVKNQIALANLDLNIAYGVVYAVPGSEHMVDYFFELVPTPRSFQWNIMNSYVINNSCVDIDGVICVDPTEEENDDGEKYISFLENARPLWTPKVRIKALVTCRLEKYRYLTMFWLEKNNIEYDDLYMMDLPDKKARTLYGHSKFKAEIFKRTGADYFIESSIMQAKEIVKLTHKPVFCTENMRFLDYNEPKIKKYLKLSLSKFLPDKIYQKIAIFYRKKNA